MRKRIWSPSGPWRVQRRWAATLVALSSLYGAFLAGGAESARILAIIFDASVDGRGP